MWNIYFQSRANIEKQLLGLTVQYTRVGNSSISFSIESIVFCDRKIDLIMEKIESLHRSFLKIDVIDSLTVDLL